MFKKLVTTVLIIVSMTVGTTMYSYPITCTKMRIMRTEVILLGDFHSMYSEELTNRFSAQTEEDNHVLQKWIRNLSHSSEATLFLLECRRKDMFPPPARDISSERCDTLQFLYYLSVELADNPTSNVEFNYADRRSGALLLFLCLDGPIIKVICDVLKETFIRSSRLSDLLHPEVIRLEDLNRSMNESERREFLSSSMTEIRCRLSDILSGSQRPSFPAEEMLDKLVGIIQVLEGYKDSYAPDTPQYAQLNIFLNNINMFREHLEAFLIGYLPDRSQPFHTAILNSIEATLSFQPYYNLYEEYMHVSMTIADACFYMDITNAIRSGVQRVVLYAGASHTQALKLKLVETYSTPDSPIIPEAVGVPELPEGRGVRVEDFLRDTRLMPIPSLELRRALEAP